MICSNVQSHNVWASYQIRKIAGCACAGNAGNVFPRRRIQRKTLVSDPVMHHGTCVTHVPWCMSGSLTRCGGENVPGILGACAPVILRIWQEAHGFHDSIVITQYYMQYGHCYGKTTIITLNSWMRLCSSSIREDIYREYFTKQSVRTTATPLHLRIRKWTAHYWAHRLETVAASYRPMYLTHGQAHMGQMEKYYHCMTQFHLRKALTNCVGTKMIEGMLMRFSQNSVSSHIAEQHLKGLNT